MKIRYLFDKPLSSGEVKYHWKPSPKLRRAGWTNLDCGTDRIQAIILAENRNKEVAEWERGIANAAQHNGKAAMRSMEDLIDAYKRDDAFRRLKPSTRDGYNTSLRKILFWTDGGMTPVAHVDRQQVLALRGALFADGPNAPGAGLLRVLRILMGFAVDQGVISVNPAEKIRIPQMASRHHIIRPDAVELLHDTATRLGFSAVSLSILLGFWTMQRQADLLDYTKADWGTVHDSDIPKAAATSLMDQNGQIWALQNEQNKTGQWVAAPLPPDIRQLVAARIAQNDSRTVPVLNILADDQLPRRYPKRLFQKHWNRVRMFAWARAMQDRDYKLAKHIRSSQFRDLRRTGMCHFAELGVPVPWIAAISGHSIDYTQKILDTYMPANTKFAIMGVAEAVSRAARASAISKEIDG